MQETRQLNKMASSAARTVTFNMQYVTTIVKSGIVLRMLSFCAAPKKQRRPAMANRSRVRCCCSQFCAWRWPSVRFL